MHGSGTEPPHRDGLGGEPLELGAMLDGSPSASPGGAEPAAPGGPSESEAGATRRPPSVPGVELAGWPGDAGAGEVWAGMTEPAGEPCVVRLVRLPAAADPVRRRQAVAAGRRLAELRHPHLVPVLAVEEVDDGLAVVMERVPDAVSLRRLLAARGRLEPGEVVTVGLPVAQALAAAHAAGLGHGALLPVDILLEPNGRPWLAGAGVVALGALVTGGAGPNPAADVYDLADLLLDTMARATGPDAAAVAVAVATALVPDPARRPSAAELAGSLAHSARPLPVQMISPPPPVPPPGEEDFHSSADPRRLVPAADAAHSGADEGDEAGEADEGDEDPYVDAHAYADGAEYADIHVDGTAFAEGTAYEDGAAHAGGLAYADGDSADEGVVPGNGVGWDDEPGAPAYGAGPDADLDEGPGVDRAGDVAEAVVVGGPDEPAAGRTVVEGAVVDMDVLPALPPGPGETVPRTRRGPSGQPSRPFADRGTGRWDGAGFPGRKSGGRSGGGSTRTGDREAGGSGGGRGGHRPAGGRPGARALRQGSRGARAGRRLPGWLLGVTAAVGLATVAVAVVLLSASTGGGSGDGAGAPVPGVGNGQVSATGGATTVPSGSQAATTQPPEERWRAVLAELAQARSLAFEQADESLLTGVYQDGTAILAQEQATMRQMVDNGGHVSRLTSRILELTIVEEEQDRAVLRVTEQLDPYDFLDGDGQVIAHADGKEFRRDLTLARTPSGWRIAGGVAAP
ncbi:protein kinase family protein [Frankia nepalensis]|nr:serine/threonine protein kinase [Frankia nepalensis]